MKSKATLKLLDAVITGGGNCSHRKLPCHAMQFCEQAQVLPTLGNEKHHGEDALQRELEQKRHVRVRDSSEAPWENNHEAEERECHMEMETEGHRQGNEQVEQRKQMTSRLHTARMLLVFSKCAACIVTIIRMVMA